MVDEADMRILARLQRNARDSQKVIASDLGITEPTLSKKIKKLEAEKIIRRFTIEIDYSKIGYSLSAMTLIREKKQSDTDNTLEFLCNFPEAIQVYKVTGEWDFGVIWLCRDSERLDDILSKSLNHPNVDKVETTFFMRALKRNNGVSLEALPGIYKFDEGE